MWNKGFKYVMFLYGSFIDVKNMFSKLELRYYLPWNWIIRVFTIMGLFDVLLPYVLL